MLTQELNKTLTVSRVEIEKLSNNEGPRTGASEKIL